MIIDIRTIPQGRSTVSQTAVLEAFAADLPPLEGKISCEADIDRFGQILHVHLRFKGTLLLECSRCVEQFVYPVSGAMRLVVREQPGRSGPSQDDETVDFFFDCRHLEVDLGSAIYEEIMTSLPIKPLCSEECKGIPLGDTHGSEGAIDPRWEALKKIRPK